MIIYQIGNFWNFDSFTNCQIYEFVNLEKYEIRVEKLKR